MPNIKQKKIKAIKLSIFPAPDKNLIEKIIKVAYTPHKLI